MEIVAGVLLLVAVLVARLFGPRTGPGFTGSTAYRVPGTDTIIIEWD
jgi:CRISPR/Cas system endoribonuclease Cas6 (RAMP superfamily)